VINETTFPISPGRGYQPTFQDRVRVDDGREGTVIGFYRREPEGVLVAFAGGESAEFLVANLEPA
jgi:hypothetical protein